MSSYPDSLGRWVHDGMPSSLKLPEPTVLIHGDFPIFLVFLYYLTFVFIVLYYVNAGIICKCIIKY